MVNLAGSSKLLRAMNLGAALDLLFQRGQLTRGELREATGLSKPTVSEAMRRLVDAGLAVVVGHVRGGPGPHAEIYAINAEAAYAAAVAVRDDVGGPWLSAALCDLTGTVRANVAHRLTGTDAVTALTSAVQALTAATGRTALPLAGVQLSVAGAFDPKTRTIHHVDLPGFDRPGLVDAVSSQVGAPVWVDNDVNLAAVAERRHGHGAAAHTFALMWLGEGLGLAIDLDGVILRGARGGAGEIGYMPVRDPERPMSPRTCKRCSGATRCVRLPRATATLPTR